MKRVLLPLAISVLPFACYDPLPTDDPPTSSHEGGVPSPVDASADTAEASAPWTDAARASGDAGADTSAPAIDPREAPGVFVGTGSLLRHVRSLDDGITWVDDATELTSADGTGDELGFRTTAFLDGKFLAFAARIYTSPDGKTWAMARGTDQWVASMVYAQGQYVSSGGYGWLATTTSDLGHWSQHPPRVDYTSAHHSRGALTHGVVAGNDAYVVVNDDGEIFYSSDGRAWSPAPGAPVVPAGNTWGTFFVFGNGVFVGLLPYGSATIRSVDGGKTWTTNTPFATNAASIVFAQGKFSAIAAGRVFTSTDGQTWTDLVAATAPFAEVMTYGHGAYIAAEWNGKIHRSTDTINWTQVLDTSSSDTPITSLAFGPK